MQVILTATPNRHNRYALAYTVADFARQRPKAQIIRTGDGMEDFRAEGYATGCFVAEGTLAHCYDSLRNYENGRLTYGDPDTDWQLMAV